MKKRLLKLMSLCLFAVILIGCGGSTASSTSGTASAGTTTGTTAGTEDSAEMVTIDKLSIAYVPSYDADLILESTAPLKQLLIDELAKYNFDVKEVEITVGTSFEAVGEALAAGSADIGFVGASVYVTFEDEVDLLLTATRYEMNKVGEDPAIWNDGTPVTRTGDVLTTGYNGLIYAGPSAKGQELAAKVENGEELTWEDLNSATWAVANTTSNAGYLYPCLWLKKNYDHMISDLATVIPGTNYPTMFAQAASEQIDIFMVFADGREQYEEAWQGEMGREGSIWDEVKVIGVTERIMNDVVIGSQTSTAMTTPGFRDAFAQAMTAVATTPEGLEAISVYSHMGYVPGNPEDYESMREVQALVRDIG